MDAVGAKTEEEGFNPLVNAVLSGEVRKLPGELQRLSDLSLNPVAVALALERRAAQLAGLAARLGPGGNLDSLDNGQLRSLGVFWRDRRDLSVQMKRWNAAKLQRLVPRLSKLHRDLLANSQMGELLLAQGLTEIARAAARN